MKQDLIDKGGSPRAIEEEWLVRGIRAYLPGVFEEVGQPGVRMWMSSSAVAAGTGSRIDKLHTLHLEGYRRFDFMLLHTHTAPSGRMQLLYIHHMAPSCVNRVIFHKLANDTLMEHLYFLPVYILA